MPAHAVVAEPREEVQHGVARRQLAALREAPADEDFPVEAPCVALVTSMFANAVDAGLDHGPVYFLFYAQVGEDAFPLENASEMGWLASCFPCFDVGCWDLIARNTEGPAGF